MGSMAQTQGMGYQDRVPPRQPLSHETSQDSSSRNSFETPDGSEARQSLPPTTSAPSRIQDAPMSPVRINHQNEEWALPSTVQIENMTTRMHDTSIAGHNADSQQYHRGSEGTIRPAAKRQVYPEQGQRHASHAGVLSNMRGSPQPYNDESPRNGRRSDDSSSSGGVKNVPPLRYHHLPHRSVDSHYNQSPGEDQTRRHLTPITTDQARKSYLQRPQSAYSAYSELPLNRGPSPQYENGPRRTPDGSRPGSYVELNGQYPQVAPTFDNSDLRAVVGNNASLLSTHKTLEMYRANLKNNTNPDTHYTFALLLIDAAREQALNEPEGTPDRKPSPKLARDLESPYVETQASTSRELIREAKKILERLADRSYPYAQYYLADGYATGFFNKGKEDPEKAFGLFVAASKHGHAESAYRAALAYEFGWGTRKDPEKAQQFYRSAAVKNHPGAMTRLGRAGLAGDLGEATEREAIKWLKRATESADGQHFDAPFYLAQLYEKGFGSDIFKDETYAAQLFTQAADLGHADAAFRLGEAYEHGSLGCPRDPSLSVHFYTMAAAKGHPTAMFNLCAWYMVGAEPVLEKDEDEAYEWAKRAADAGMYQVFRYWWTFFYLSAFAGVPAGKYRTRGLLLPPSCDPRFDDRWRTTNLPSVGASIAAARAAQGLFADKLSASKLKTASEGHESYSASLRFVKRYWPEEAKYESGWYRNYKVGGLTWKPAPTVFKSKFKIPSGWIGGWSDEVFRGARAELVKAGVFRPSFVQHRLRIGVSSMPVVRPAMQLPLPQTSLARSNRGVTILPVIYDDSPWPSTLSKSLSGASPRSPFGKMSNSSGHSVSEVGSARRAPHASIRSSMADEEVATSALSRGTSISGFQSTLSLPDLISRSLSAENQGVARDYEVLDPVFYDDDGVPKGTLSEMNKAWDKLVRSASSVDVARGSTPPSLLDLYLHSLSVKNQRVARDYEVLDPVFYDDNGLPKGTLSDMNKSWAKLVGSKSSVDVARGPMPPVATNVAPILKSILKRPRILARSTSCDDLARPESWQTVVPLSLTRRASAPAVFELSRATKSIPSKSDKRKASRNVSFASTEATVHYFDDEESPSESGGDHELRERWLALHVEKLEPSDARSKSNAGSKARSSVSSPEPRPRTVYVPPPAMPRGKLVVRNMPDPLDTSINVSHESGDEHKLHASDSMPKLSLKQNSVLAQHEGPLSSSKVTSLVDESLGSRSSSTRLENHSGYLGLGYVGEFAVENPGFRYPFPESAKSRFMDKYYGIPFCSYSFKPGYGFSIHCPDIGPSCLSNGAVDDSTSANIDETGLAKAEYAVGYFTEMGIGCRRDPLEANVWYVQAAEKGEQRAIERLNKIAQMAEGGPHAAGMVMGKGGKKLDISNIGKKEKEAKMSTKELKKKVEEGRQAGLSAGLPNRKSSLPAGAAELQLPLPLGASSGNVDANVNANVNPSANTGTGDKKLAKTAAAPGEKKPCIVM